MTRDGVSKKSTKTKVFGGCDANDYRLFSRRQSVKNRLHYFDAQIDTNDNEHLLVECAVFPATKLEGGGRETDDYPLGVQRA